MSDGSSSIRIDRRRLLLTGGASALLAGCGGSAAQVVEGRTVPISQSADGLTSDLDNRQLMDIERAGLERRVSGFRARRWEDYFSDLDRGAALVDTQARVLHFWSNSVGVYKIYPTSVPLTPELTRTGRTEVVRKREGPDWRPTPNMLKRDPTLPTYVGPGPQNPLGTHALYLSWQYYRIHGTNDQRKIGRKSSNGCIGLYNEDIAELFGWAEVGMPVLVV